MGESFKQLEVWQLAIEMTFAIYQLTKSFPDSERFGLTNQLRRAAISVQATSQKATAAQQEANTFNFLAMHADPFAKSKRSWSSSVDLALVL